MVDGHGIFKVEWHLAGDLKTLKCLFGCDTGASAKLTCLYCMSSQKTQKGGLQWENGILSCDQRLAPDRDKKDSKWDPILPIPLERVHICTLHAELCILDKLLYLHLVYAWTLIPTELSAHCISRAEKLLSDMGFHGGHVRLKEDKKMSGKTQNLPAKVSMGGAKARRFLSNHNLGKEKHTLSHSPSSWECWKALCECTTNNASHPSTMTLRAKVWPKLDAFVKLLRQSQSDEMYYEKFKMAVIEFTQPNGKCMGRDTYNILHGNHIFIDIFCTCYV